MQYKWRSRTFDLILYIYTLFFIHEDKHNNPSLPVSQRLRSSSYLGKYFCNTVVKVRRLSWPATRHPSLWAAMVFAWRPDKQVTSGIAAEIMDGTIPAVVYNPFVWRMAEWRSGVSCFRRMTWGAVYTGQDTGPPHSLEMTHDLSRRSYESLSLAWTPGSVAPGHLPSDTHIYTVMHIHIGWYIYFALLINQSLHALVEWHIWCTLAGLVWLEYIGFLISQLPFVKLPFFSKSKTGSPHSKNVVSYERKTDIMRWRYESNFCTLGYKLQLYCHYYNRKSPKSWDRSQDSHNLERGRKYPCLDWKITASRGYDCERQEDAAGNNFKPTFY